MSDQAQTTQRLRGPRHLLGGKWRRRREVAAVLVALAPALVVAVACLVAAVAVSLIVGALMVAVAVALVALVEPVRTTATWSWYRTRWYLDARAAGLAVEAEPNLWAGTDTPLDRVIVVVPRVRITVDPYGTRTYRCRPLAGQSVGDYEQAVGRLSLRWGVEHVTLEAELGSKFVTFTVHRGAPPVTEYRRAS